MFEVTIFRDFRPNDYRVYKGKIVIPGYIQDQREELAVRSKLVMARQGLKIIEGACRLELHICRNQNPMKDWFGDGDNFCKWVADALTGVVYRNDAQIMEYHIFKRRGSTPWLGVKVDELVMN